MADLSLLDKGGPSDVTAWLESGGTLVIAGAPPADDAAHAAATAAGRLRWLPATAEAANGGRPKLVHHDLRLYLVPDSGRLLQIPFQANPSDKWRHLRAPAQGDATPMEVQGRIMKAILQRLGAGTASADRSGSLGSIPGQGDRDVSVSVPPPVVIDVEVGTNATNPARFAGDLAGSSIAGRLSALMEGADDETKRPFPLLYPSDRYPGTVVVLFVTDAARGPFDNADISLRRLALGAAVSSGGTPIPWSTAGAGQHLYNCSDLQRMGIRIAVVRLPLWPLLHQQTMPGSPEQCLEGTIVADLRQAQDDRAINQAAETIISLLRVRGITQTVWNGRVIDPRVAKERDQPIATHQILRQFQAPSGLGSQRVLTDPAAVIAAPQMSMPASNRPVALPLIINRRVGNGRVITLAYSPFSRDVWNTDFALDYLDPPGQRRLGNVDRATEVERAGGWGLRRVLDAVYRTPLPTPSASDFILYRIDALPGDTGLILHTWLPLQGLAGFKPPSITLSGQTYATDLADVDFSSQNATFVFTTDADLGPALGQINLGMSSQVAAFINVVRRPSTGAGTAAQALQILANASGGGVIGQAGLAGRTLGGAAAASLGLVACALVLVSPLVKPWRAVGVWLRRWKQIRLKQDLQPIRIDIDATVEALGQRPAGLEASRRAGVPAWVRPYQSGDSLSRARPQDLFTYTEFAHALGFVPVLPKVRQREIEQSFDTVLLIDAGASLIVPVERPYNRRSALVMRMAEIVAECVWSQRGIIYLARPARSAEQFGPWQRDRKDHLLTTLDSLLNQATAPKAAQIDFPDNFPPLRRQMVVLISDLLSDSAQAYQKLYATCAARDLRLRVIVVSDKEDGTYIGLGRIAGRRGIVDRTEWTKSDLRYALQRRRQNLKGAAEQAGGVHIEVTADTTEYELVELLSQSRFFTMRL